MTDGRNRSNPTDLFVAINLFVFLLMAVLVYWDRFQTYRGPANVDEFFIYAVIIAGVILVLWRILRNVDFPVWLLLVGQIGILAHFAGGLVPVGEGRLYDVDWAGLHYDKLVHAYNAFAGAALIGHVLRARGARLPAAGLIVVGLVLGVGAVIEIAEYLVMLTVPGAGVGTYDNNMQDMIANGFGAMTMVTSTFLWQRYGARA